MPNYLWSQMCDLGGVYFLKLFFKSNLLLDFILFILLLFVDLILISDFFYWIEKNKIFNFF